MNTNIMTITARSFFFRLATALAIVLLFAILARAGGPKYVAGSSFFNTSGQSIVWASGQVNYYTDQGDLSPILANASANALVADAFSRWTSVSAAALTASKVSDLSEDVNGSNIAVDSNGAVTAPADIASVAIQTPVGIVYDYDGSVTDALLGAGAGNPSQCFWNAVYGGADNFGVGGNFLHALVVINGQCALESSQLTDIEYRLVRVLGSVIGLGWSQMNLNVITGNPRPTSDDFAGFPVMHAIDPFSCTPITICYATPYQLSVDDVAALSRLYPANQSGSAASARIHGSVYFVDHVENIAQPMQGVNVVARWVDPSSGLPSHKYSVTSVSGFLFTGNAGNPITGWSDSLGNLYSKFGSSDENLEGFFDLSGLPIPDGVGTAQYQLSVEAVDPLWSSGVGPYEWSEVKPSGTSQPLVVTVAAGADFAQDILMTGSGQPVPSWAASETWDAPAPVLSPGDWVGSLSGYGVADYFLIAAQANRTLSVAVTALDETGAPSESKTEPVVGIWTFGDPQGTAPPAFTPSPFNSENFGMSRLDAQILNSNSFIIGIADVRGDGRPDYHYHAHVLYGDTVSPTRLPVSGGGVTLQGIGFAPGLAVKVGSASELLLATNAAQMLVSASGKIDGPQTITINDPVSGASSVMTNALTFGAAASDRIILLQGGNPPTPVGTQATNPVSVRVVASDGVTPVSGATVGWTSTNGAALSVCGGASACSSVSDESGIVSTSLTPAATGTAVVTASVAPAVYTPPASVSATLSATSSSLDIGVTTPYLWIAQGATVSVPLTARVVSRGIAQSGVTVNFFIDQGTGSLSAPSALSSSTGYASITLTVTNFTGSVQLSACVAPGNNPCQTIYGNAVAPALINLQPVAGSGQIVTRTAFQPLAVRVIDFSIPPNAVLGANVTFQSTVLRPTGNGLENTSQSAMPVILSESQSTVQSDIHGMASFIPSVGAFTGSLEIDIQVSAGITAALETLMQAFPSGTGGDASSSNTDLWHRGVPAAGGTLRQLGNDDR